MSKQGWSFDSAEMISQTRNLIRIPSVEGAPQDGCPFGREPARALEHVLQLGASMGFRTRNFDNYAGDIEFGQGKEVLGILVHVDVVPEGRGWTYPPFSGEVHNGRIYGRGALDDKGPIIAALHAMRAVAASGWSLGKRVRMILGANEETGWQGIAHYLSIKEAPQVAFTPDADFPLIRGEKGILKVRVEKPMSAGQNDMALPFTLSGGLSINAVPERCEACFPAHSPWIDPIRELIRQCDPAGQTFHLAPAATGPCLCAQGVSAHGSTPEAGHNAISHMLCLLRRISFGHPLLDAFLAFYASRIGLDFNGRQIGLGFSDDISGPLTFNVGRISIDDQKISMLIDIRYPLKTAMMDVVDSLHEQFGQAGFSVDIFDRLNPIYFRRQDHLVQTLMGVYQQVTGDMESQPLIIGGGTYARALKQAVAFGPLLPGRKDTSHQKDEHIRIEDLQTCARIYAHAIAALAK